MADRHPVFAMFRDGFETVVNRLPSDGGPVVEAWRGHVELVGLAVRGLEAQQRTLEGTGSFTQQGIVEALKVEAGRGLLPALVKIAADRATAADQRAKALAALQPPPLDGSVAAVSLRREVRDRLHDAGLSDRIAMLLSEDPLVVEAVREVPALLLGVDPDVVEKFQRREDERARAGNPQAARALDILEQADGVLAAVESGAAMILKELRVDNDELLPMVRRIG